MLRVAAYVFVAAFLALIAWANLTTRQLVFAAPVLCWAWVVHCICAREASRNVILCAGCGGPPVSRQSALCPECQASNEILRTTGVSA